MNAISCSLVYVCNIYEINAPADVVVLVLVIVVFVVLVRSANEECKKALLWSLTNLNHLPS